MDSSVLIESFAEFAKFKNIDRPTMMRILEDVFRTMIRKKWGTDDNFDIILNVEKGDLEIWRNREIVDDNSEDIWDHDKISLTDARKIEPDFEIGEEVAEEIKLEDFGRRAVLTARQTLIQRVKDLEKDLMYQKYKDLVGEIISGEVYQVWNREVMLVDADDNELALGAAGTLRQVRADPQRPLPQRGCGPGGGAPGRHPEWHPPHHLVAHLPGISRAAV